MDILTRQQLEDAAKAHICGGIAGVQVSDIARTALAYRAMLERLEWIQTREGSDYCIPLWNCPYCENEQGEGHTSDCELSALLKGLEG